VKLRYKASWKIFGLCVFLQVLQTYFPSLVNVQCLYPADFASLRTLPLALFGLIVYQFSHAGWWHLIGNFSIGLPCMAYVESKLGEERTLEYYVLCGIAAALVFMWMPINGSALIGASGSVFGMIAGAAALFGGNNFEKRLIASAWLAVTLLPQMIMLQMSFLGGNVAVAGHIGGALAGIALLHLGYFPKGKDAPKPK